MSLIDWFKLVSPLGWALISVGALMGLALGSFLFKKFPELLNKDDKKMQEVLNNPHLLVEKLKSHGTVFDHYEDNQKKELEFSVVTDDQGKEIVQIKALPKKVLKKKDKKKVEKNLVKKKSKKKGAKK